MNSTTDSNAIVQASIQALVRRHLDGGTVTDKDFETIAYNNYLVTNTGGSPDAETGKKYAQTYGKSYRIMYEQTLQKQGVPIENTSTQAPVVSSPEHERQTPAPPDNPFKLARKKINYITQMNGFLSRKRCEPISPIMVSIYMVLFEAFNASCWRLNWIRIPTREFMHRAGLTSSHTLLRNRDLLRNLGYIDFRMEKYRGKLHTSYRLIPLDADGAAENESIT